MGSSCILKGFIEVETVCDMRYFRGYISKDNMNWGINDFFDASYRATLSNELKGLSNTKHCTLLLLLLSSYAMAKTEATAPIDRPQSTILLYF